MTKEQLEAVHDALTEIIDSWNGAAEDEDRGRANNAIHLTLWDDGSGSIGRRRPPYPGPGGKDVEDIEDWHEFADADGLLRIIMEQGVEIEGLPLEPTPVVKKSPPDECPGHERGGTRPPCCDRAGEYNGFDSGPTIFDCPKGCSCHD